MFLRAGELRFVVDPSGALLTALVLCFAIHCHSLPIDAELVTRVRTSFALQGGHRVFRAPVSMAHLEL